MAKRVRPATVQSRRSNATAERRQQQVFDSEHTSKPSISYSSEHGGFTESEYSGSSSAPQQAAEFAALKCILLREGLLKRLKDAAGELNAAQTEAARVRVPALLAKVDTAFMTQ